MTTPFPLRLYSAAATALRPAAPLLLARRAARGKEDSARIGERRGRASAKRPEGTLLWLHGASVGESLSILPLIDLLLASRADLTILVTSGTLTSAQLLAERLPERAIHQFVPLDAPAYARRFLDHWKPDLAAFVESELWPNLIREAARRDIPLALVNGRLSQKSLEGWQRAPQSAGTLLGAFATIMAQDEKSEERFAALGAANVTQPGNLKFDAQPLPFDEKKLEKLQEATRARPLWLASSTHEDEELQAGQTHLALKAAFPGLLTVIAPRHPARAHEIRAQLEALGLTVAQRSLERLPREETDIYLADTMGELGLLYRLCPLVFMGGSLIPHGGHNPLEPARLGAALLFGPHMFNFTVPAGHLLAQGGALEVKDRAALTDALKNLLNAPDEVGARAEQAHNAASLLGGASMRVAHQLLALMPEGSARERPHA